MSELVDILNQSAKPRVAPKMSDIPDVTDSTQLALAIGEMRGQVREMVHTQNNMVQKVDAMASMAMLSASLPDAVAALTLRVTALEKEGNRRDGRDGVLVALFRSPAMGWIVGGLTYVSLWVSGKLDS